MMIYIVTFFLIVGPYKFQQERKGFVDRTEAVLFLNSCYMRIPDMEPELDSVSSDNKIIEYVNKNGSLCIQ